MIGRYRQPPYWSDFRRSVGPLTSCLVLGLGLALPATAAQQRVQAEDPELPAAVAEAVVAYFNRAETVRIWGAATIPPGTQVSGDLAVVGGNLLVAGEVQGRVMVINGEARLEPGSRIVGDLTVVGGGVAGFEPGRVTGQVVSYPQPLRYRRDQGGLSYTPYRTEPALTAGRELGFGRIDFLVASRQSYNRVEGLPIAFGPRLELGHSNPTRLEALVIHRTETGLRLSRRETGYSVRVEQAIGGLRMLHVGAVLRSEISPIEDWGLTRSEASLATFFLRRDYRDHYERIGHEFYLGIGSPARPASASLSYLDERHHIVAARGPWALFGNHEDWRPQPAIAAGDLRSLALRFRYDTRNATGDASTGWLLALGLEQGLGGSLTDPVVLDAETGVPTFGSQPANAKFSHAFLDLRRYARLSPDSRVALRLVAGGSIDDRRLPPQRQHALGGEGSLPGYRLFEFDCGARQHTLEFPQARFHPYYGCDRMILMQLDYEARLPFGSWLGEQIGWRLDTRGMPAGVVFVNTGRAWNEPGELAGRGRGQDDFAVDAGIGIRLGALGAYWAVPLSGGGHDINFFVRLGARP